MPNSLVDSQSAEQATNNNAQTEGYGHPHEQPRYEDAINIYFLVHLCFSCAPSRGASATVKIKQSAHSLTLTDKLGVEGKRH